MGTDIAVARAQDAIPVVANATDRDIRYPTPTATQRVQRSDTGAVEQYTGSAWVTLVAGAPSGATLTTAPDSLTGLLASVPKTVSAAGVAAMLAGQSITGALTVTGALASLVDSSNYTASGTHDFTLPSASMYLLSARGANNSLQQIAALVYCNNAGGVTVTVLSAIVFTLSAPANNTLRLTNGTTAQTIFTNLLRLV